MIVGPQKSVPLREVAEAWYLRPQELPPDVDLGGLEATVGFKPKRDTGAFSYASHAAVVAVDTEIGEVEILDYVIVEDCGTLVNPMVVEGQTLGGVAQGIGTALYEESPFDANGQPLASTFADYLLPGPTEIPADPHLSHGDAVALHRVRHQGHGRRRRDRAAGRDLQCGQRCAAAAGRGADRDAADAAPAAGGDRARQAVGVAPAGSRMKAARFDYVRPGDVAEALAALAKAAGSAKLWPAASRSVRC